MNRIDMKKAVYILSDGGNQEGDLTALEQPVILIPNEDGLDTEELADKLSDLNTPHSIVTDLPCQVYGVDKVITISNNYTDSSYLEKHEDKVVYGSDTNVIGFKFSDTGLMHELGLTMIISKVFNEDNPISERVWVTERTFEETLQLLEKSGISMTGETAETFEEFLEYNMNFIEITNAIFYDYFNEEYVKIDTYNEDGEE